MQYAYVLNKRGEPLMPCSPGKARILLKQQNARRSPSNSCMEVRDTNSLSLWALTPVASTWVFLHLLKSENYTVKSSLPATM